MPRLRDLLRRQREQRGLSQEELAALVEPPLSPDTISNVERGRTRPHRHTLETLCQALGLDESARQEVWAAWRLAGAAESSASTGPAIPPGGTGAAQPTPLIGRQQELHVVQQRLLQPEVRLLTLVGPGGVGKTRLALAVMERVAEWFADGARFIDLSALREADLVVPTVARALGIRDAGGQSVRQALMDALHTLTVLLVLDNFEHVLDAAAGLAELLSACPHLELLATSREPLRLRWEHLHVVPSLGIPDPRDLASLEAVRAAPAVALFLQRAQAADETFALTEANAPTIAALCRRLDGLPLALELAAARVRTLSPAMLLDHLDRQLDLLKGARDAPARQQSLRATLDWSYQLLSQAERRLFERLAVFAGGWTLESAKAICTAGGELVDRLASLLDKSLLQRTDTASAEPRWRMLETIHGYALEQLELSGEAGTVRQRHAEHFLSLAEAADLELRGSPSSVWLDRLQTEHDNLRAALAWAAETHAAELALRLCVALRRYWNARGHLNEGRRWLEGALALDAPVPPSVRARALQVAGRLAWRLGDYARAGALHGESLALYRKLGDTAGSAPVLNSLGILARNRGDLMSARALYEEALAIYRALGDTPNVAWVLNNLAGVARDHRDWSWTLELCAESLALLNDLGDAWGTAQTLANVGVVAQQQGEAERAARLFGAAEALREAATGSSFYSVWPAERATYEAAVRAARAALGEPAFAAAWRAGRELPLAEAVAEGLVSTPVRRAPRGLAL